MGKLATFCTASVRTSPKKMQSQPHALGVNWLNLNFHVPQILQQVRPHISVFIRTAKRRQRDQNNEQSDGCVRVARGNYRLRI